MEKQNSDMHHEIQMVCEWAFQTMPVDELARGELNKQSISWTENCWIVVIMCMSSVYKGINTFQSSILSCH